MSYEPSVNITTIGKIELSSIIPCTSLHNMIYFFIVERMTEEYQHVIEQFSHHMYAKYWCLNVPHSLVPKI